MRRRSRVSRLKSADGKLWPGDTVVEFDGSINAAILKLRSAMRSESGDDGFIETVARRGYRLLIPAQNEKQE